MKHLQVDQLSKSFGAATVLKEVSFSVDRGKTLSVLGQSGSGKTTLLQIIAGLVREDQGELRVFGNSPKEYHLINALPIEKRGVVYLSQEALLFEHMTVYENIAFGLRVKKWTSEKIEQAVHKWLAAIGLEAHAEKSPSQLSGGQKQRVAFARAFAIEPRLVLLDEPFSALDSKTRKQMQALFKTITQQEQLTSIFITHDLKEALLMGDDLAVIKEGRLKQYNDQKAFFADPLTGVQDEYAFWQQFNEQ